jgi:hypothetical protein
VAYAVLRRVVVNDNPAQVFYQVFVGGMVTRVNKGFQLLGKDIPVNGHKIPAYIGFKNPCRAGVVARNAAVKTLKK